MISKRERLALTRFRETLHGNANLKELDQNALTCQTKQVRLQSFSIVINVDNLKNSLNNFINVIKNV